MDTITGSGGVPVVPHTLGGTGIPVNPQVPNQSGISLEGNFCRSATSADRP